MVKSKRAREALDVVDNEDGGAQLKKRKVNGEANGIHSDEKSTEKESTKVKKEKKDKKDKKRKHEKESRKERKEKKKDIADLPEDLEDTEEAAVEETPAVDKVKVEKKEKKDKTKKDKKDKKRDKKKDKSDRKDKEGQADTTEDKAEEKPAASSTDPIDLPHGASDNANRTPNGDQPQSQEKQERHIVFVGNLPFTATAASITAHFASLSPIAVRCLRNKEEDAPPCRGIAFVEFGKVWHMRTCLDKFHHSWFEDGVSPGRKINVELTAGGGGKTQERQKKIRDKNKKLEKNRKVRIEKAKLAKTEGEGTNKPAPKPQDSNMEDAVHPSRRSRMSDWN